MVNLFGKGFIGTHFASQGPCVINDKNDLVPNLTNVDNLLYLISTVDNYNVKTNPYLDIETNLTTLVRVLENFRKDPNSPNVVFNFASSWFVYGDTDLPATEKSICDPKGFYSITKRAAEQLLVSYCETYNLKYRILRLANVLGPGDTKVSKKKNALTYLLTELKYDRPIELYEGGNLIRDYIHVDDLCSAINLIMTTGDINSIYNVGNGLPLKFRDIIDYAVSKGSISKIKNIPQTPFHKQVQVWSMYMDTTKLSNLGYVPKYTIFDIVDELLEKQTQE